MWLYGCLDRRESAGGVRSGPVSCCIRCQCHSAPGSWRLLSIKYPVCPAQSSQARTWYPWHSTLPQHSTSTCHILHMCPSLASVSVLCVLSRENDACINSWKTFYNILSVKRKLVGFTNFVSTVFNVIGQQEHNRRQQFMELETVSHFVSPCLAWLGCGVVWRRKDLEMLGTSYH